MRPLRVPIAREGQPFIFGAASAAVLLSAGWLWADGKALAVLASLASLLALAFAFFFRDPERRGPRGPDLVIAPADGRVVDVSGHDERTFLAGRALRISIFLSLLDVHVNRYPVSGRVEHRAYDRGGFRAAWRASAALHNERASTGIRAKAGPVLIRQVAGLVARRIVTYAREGQSVRQGDRMGLIRFGSRLDVYLPEDAAPQVRIGERAVGGVTVIARLSPGDRG